jgi:hypothetical protein
MSKPRIILPASCWAVILVAAIAAGSMLLSGPQVAFAKTKPQAQTPTPVPTAAPVVSSPERPLAYSDQWVDIKPGEWHWYSFKYSFDDSSDSKQAPATIRLDASPDTDVTLVLLNGEQVRAWEHGEKLQGFGAATPVTDPVPVKVKLGTYCESHPGDPVCTGNPNRTNTQCENLRDPARQSKTCDYTTEESRGYATWSGLIGASGIYYVLVRGNPDSAGPLQYKITVTGDGLSMQ